MGYLTERLLHTEQGCCCCECGCENEHDHEEIVEKSLSESEIEGIISEKYSEKDEKTKEFIRKGLRKFGNRFDYSKTEYKNAKTKVIIVCKVHGDFSQSPDSHLHNKGCPMCSGRGVTTEEFIRRATAVHGNKYNYDKTKYLSPHTKVIITCPIHGDFEQTPNNHLKYGCIKCGKQSMADSRRYTTEEFIELARKVHGDKYDYSKTNYINFNTKVVITCPIHGDFEQTPNNHLKGENCPACVNKIKINTEMFIDRAIKVHGEGTYLYNRVNYVNSYTLVEIYDPLYEEYFFQSPEVHLRGSGNPNRKMSSGERQVYLWLKSMDIDFSREVLIENTFGRHGNGIIVDFMIDNYNNHKIIIEYNGGQHYKFTTKFHSTVEDFNAQLKRDNELRDYCKINSIILIELPFILKTSTEISDFLTKTLIEEIDQHMLVDYDSLYAFDDNST